MSELRPLPTFLFENKKRPAYRRRPEPSFLSQICIPIILGVAMLAVGSAIGFYLLFGLP
jgi:hypothetical protein